ncbi:leukemia inhibitory factor receptor-like [Xiphias gladius]|uniref:leukemia inhibitory factor receptor-like n=1 Tax=Xiphias gladius TaxID=8245 RepID=UPI001A981042|nr:leukemia inhibitory factor receptor-like [Xiphias gladius]XP_040013096.1 leukemia inhibitory factor receptor-like [Xiphias gladius]
MIQWLLLVTLFCKSTQDGNGQENGVFHCGPPNLTLNKSVQTILLAWEDDPSCSAVHDVLIYELVVLIADKQVHYDEVAVTHEQIGSPHSWNWTSHLALECASHTVRLSSRYENRTSPWKQEQTLPGKENLSRPEVYPRDRVLKVGSTVTFCCVLPAGEIFDKMYLPGYNSTIMNTTKINNRTYALTVRLNQPSRDSCTDVKCKASIQHVKTTENGACAFIGYLPGDKDLQCETSDLESVECHWTVERSPHLLSKKTEYQLLGSPCEDGSRGRCLKKVQEDAGERNWTLTVKNKLGKVELSDRADLTKRVHMLAPEGVKASTVNARNVTLEWSWKVQRYTNLNLTCQVNVSHGGTNTMSENIGLGLSFAVLTDLIPNWTYNVTVRCGTTQNFWKWSDWSIGFNFNTKGDVPDALDVWMQVKDNQIIIIWKMPLANQSHGHILDYEVTWAKTKATVANSKHHLALSLDTTEDYIVAVTARNINGSSSPSTITTPPFNPNKTGVNNLQINRKNGSFSLSWSASPAASCGYIVDWCPTSGHCSLEWLKVPPHEHNANIFSKNLKDGLRYSLSLYACTQGAPVLLERGEGYVSEERIKDGLFVPLKWKQQDSDVEVSWNPVSLTEQTAFIQGYILYCTDKDNDNKIVCNVSTDNPEAITLRASHLKIGSYEFTVKARTAVGECGTTSLTATLNSQTDNLIKAVIISLVTVFSLLSLITVVCLKHWACIKEMVYPPIPKPLLTDKWLTSPGEHSCHPLRVDQCQHSEVANMDIPELHCKSGGPVNDYVSPENIPFVFAQTPKGYYNQPLQKCTPPPLILATPTVPSQSGLPSSPIRGLFPNPSYNLMMQAGDQWSNPGPELQEGTCLERNSSGYQPQSRTENFTLNQTEQDPECYILLPQ